MIDCAKERKQQGRQAGDLSSCWRWKEEGGNGATRLRIQESKQAQQWELADHHRHGAAEGLQVL